jgi:hypothetical protein
MAQSGFTPIQLYRTTTASAVPLAGNLADGELAINTTDGRLFYKDNLGAVQIIATRSGATGDVVGPASSTDNGLVAFNGTTGKLVKAALTVTVAQGGTGATTLTGLVVGNGSSAFTAVTAPSGAVVGTTDTQTLTNKRVNPRIGTVASAATITPTADTSDQYNVTALATAATIAAPSGTPVDGQRLILRFEDNGTGRALTWTTTSGAYRAVGVTLPTTTVATKVTYVGCIYNTQDVFWDVVAVTTQA